MIKGIIAATEITAPRLKIAIIGDTGIGKSWLACSIASPEHKVLDLDFDGRAASLAGKENVYVKTYVDKDFNQPTAMAELESDINTWEYDYEQGRLEYKTFVIDSGSYMRKAMEREIIRQQPALSRAIKVGSRVLKIGQGYDIFNGNQMFTEHIISRLSQIGNLIITFHEKNEKDEIKSTEKQKAFTGMVTIDPQHLSGLLSTFNDVWRLTTNYASKRILITGLTDDFSGKTTLKGLADVEEPDIKKLLEKHKKFCTTNGANVANNTLQVIKQEK
jgi:hypothetical protein